jgi:hypothetical protein
LAGSWKSFRVLVVEHGVFWSTGVITEAGGVMDVAFSAMPRNRRSDAEDVLGLRRDRGITDHLRWIHSMLRVSKSGRTDPEA